jgi:hypothetical protein
MFGEQQERGAAMFGEFGAASVLVDVIGGSGFQTVRIAPSEEGRPAARRVQRPGKIHRPRLVPRLWYRLADWFKGTSRRVYGSRVTASPREDQ